MSPDSPCQQLTMTGVAGAEEMVWLHRVARLQSIERVSPASPASLASPDVFSITEIERDRISSVLWAQSLACMPTSLCIV